MTIQFDPTALRGPAETPRDSLLSGRVSALILIVAGCLAIVGLLGWAVFVPHTPALDVVWPAKLGSGVTAAPVVCGDSPLGGGDDGSLAALDARTGVLSYVTHPALLGIAGGLVVHDGVVYFGAMDNGVYAVDPNSGETLQRAFTNGAVASSPLVVDNKLYVCSDDRSLWRFSLPDLRLIPSPIHMGGAVASDPISVRDDVVVAASTGGVRFYNTKTGLVRTADVPGPIYASPCEVRGTVWIGNDLGEVYSVDAETLKLTLVDTMPGPVRSGLASGGGALYVGCNANVLRAYVEKLGLPRYDVQTTGAVRSRPLLAGDLLAMGCDDGGVRVCQSNRGNLMAVHRMTPCLTGPAPVAGPDGLIYIANGVGEVHALRMPR